MSAARAKKKAARPKLDSKKRKAIIDAATETFLEHGYLGVSMDRIAAHANVAKRTVYAYFASKEALFVAILQDMTHSIDEALLQISSPEPKDQKQLAERLIAFAERQLSSAYTERPVKLARLAISEVNRFPEFGRALYEGGTRRDIDILTHAFERWSKLGLLQIDSPIVAATQFKGMLTGDLLQRAFFLSHESIPDRAFLRVYAESCVKTFLAAVGKTK